MTFSLRPLNLGAACLASLCALPVAHADNARDWQNMPINVPVGFAYYFNIDSNTAFDTNLPIKGADTNIDAGLLRFAYAFDLGNGLVSAVQVLQPYASVDLALDQTDFHAKQAAWGDTSLVFATNIFGGKALTLEEFAKFQPETFLSGAVWVTAPTGSYDGNRTINIGANRWAFKPELAFGHPFGNSWIEVNGWLQWYTDNDNYQGGSTLSQDMKLGLEAHYSYNFTPAFWVSADVFYTWGGETQIDGTDQDNRADTWQMGVGAQLALSPKDAVSAAYINTVSKPDDAPDVQLFMLSYRRLFF
ncbi:transporter [Chitiniphilus eburneus]|uniref:Transporter n=1 Tax=Chitiniphilus eburneus TaxID=2571148 RepID=A0A4U0Q3D3_9NEIS|nr:transporter [Chitiniphilus eburneus]TJZ75489.1 transporter [Chitiniphilus eburneus]